VSSIQTRIIIIVVVPAISPRILPPPTFRAVAGEDCDQDQNND
jgi:hypothetical protein